MVRGVYAGLRATSRHGDGADLAPPADVTNKWTGPERRHQPAGRRATDIQREQDNQEMRQEIDRLKAVVELLADAVQALTALHNKPNLTLLDKRRAG